MRKTICSTLLTLFIATIFFVILDATPIPAKTLLEHDWKTDSQTKGGKTVSCFLQLDAATLDAMASEPKVLSPTLITANLTLLLIEKSNRKLLAFMVKVTGKRILKELQAHEIPIHFAWVQSSTGSTAIQLTQIDAKPDKYFLGMLAGNDGMDLFAQLLKGMVVDGLVIGWQESPGKLDKVLKVKDPPPREKLISFMSCLGQLEKIF